MEARVRALEISGAKVEARLDSIDANISEIKATLRRMEDKALNRWDVALVVFVIVGGLGAAVAWGPRVASFLAP